MKTFLTSITFLLALYFTVNYTSATRHFIKHLSTPQHLLGEVKDVAISNTYNYARAEALSYWKGSLAKTIIPDTILRFVSPLTLSDIARFQTLEGKDQLISSKTIATDFCVSARLLCTSLESFYQGNQVALTSDMRVAERYSYRDSGGCPLAQFSATVPVMFPYAHDNSQAEHDALSSQNSLESNVVHSQSIPDPHDVESSETLWFSEINLLSHVGAPNALTIPARFFSNTTSSSLYRAFLPKKLVETFGNLSRKDTLMLMNQLHIPTTSPMGKVMQATAIFCEHLDLTQEADLGVQRACVRSIEGLADYVSSVLSDYVEPLNMSSFPINIKDDRSYFKVTSVKLEGDETSKVMACHSLIYAYQVYLCHSISKTRVYSVSLESTTQSDYVINTLAFCHSDTTNWNSSHESFRILGNKPGDSVVPCHLLSTNGIGFVKKQHGM